MNDESEKLINNLIQSGNYCLNMCYPIQDLHDYKKCYRTCLSFLDKKWEFVGNYLSQIDNIIKGEAVQRLNYNNTPTDNKIVDKYVFKDYYYQSNSGHDVGEPNNKPSVGSLFGRNK